MQDNPFFSPNGRIKIQPFRHDRDSDGKDELEIAYYSIGGLYTYSIRAKMNHRIFAKYPHPSDELYGDLGECKIAARDALKVFCEQNKLKKCFRRLVEPATLQLDLFDALA